MAKTFTDAAPSSQPPNTTTTATQTPPPIPTIEDLVQKIYEALSLYTASLAQHSPCGTSSPLSPSCCHPHMNSYRGNVFFSQQQQTPVSYERSSCCHPHMNSYHGNVFFSPQQQTPVSYERSYPRLVPRNEMPMPRRHLNSFGEEEDDEDIASDIGINECPCATSSSNCNIAPAPPLPANFDFEEHYTYLAARERLRQFPGQVPEKKKKVVSQVKPEAVAVKTQKKPESKEKGFLWTTVVSAAVLAVGYMSSR